MIIKCAWKIIWYRVRYFFLLKTHFTKIAAETVCPVSIPATCQLTSLELFSAITAEEHRAVSTSRVLIVNTETELYSGGGGQMCCGAGSVLSL